MPATAARPCAVAVDVDERRVDLGGDGVQVERARAGGGRPGYIVEAAAETIVGGRRILSCCLLVSKVRAGRSLVQAIGRARRRLLRMRAPARSGGEDGRPLGFRRGRPCPAVPAAVPRAPSHFRAAPGPRLCSPRWGRRGTGWARASASTGRSRTGRSRTDRRRPGSVASAATQPRRAPSRARQPSGMPAPGMSPRKRPRRSAARCTAATTRLARLGVCWVGSRSLLLVWSGFAHRCMP